MVSFGLVMLILISAINLLDYRQVQKAQNRQLHDIMAYEQTTPTKAGKRPINEMPWAGGPGREFTSRFFVVRCDAEGEVKTFGKDYIFSVDAETAASYARTALDAGKETGRTGDFRYLVSKNGDESTIVFLNISDEADRQKTLLLISLLIGFVGLFGAFALVVLLSRQMLRPYLKSIEMQKRFITDAGHELKTPITSIATSADIAAMEHENDEWITNIQSQTARLAKLVNDLVTLSRLDEEAPFPEISCFSLSELCWEAVESFQTRAKAEEKAFLVSVEEKVESRGDRNSLQKLLTILLDNALKYSPPGGEVRFSLSKKHGRACIEVSNTCLQDLSQDADHLFDRFYRPDRSRSADTGGTGLGLSIAKAIVESHNGQISVNPSENGIIVFTVMI